MHVPETPEDLFSLPGRGVPERTAAQRSEVPWNVVVVAGSETHDWFGYTVGLWPTYGHPELLLHPRPVAGADDEPDWMLSTADVGHTLNELGGQVRAGRHFSSGDTWEMSVDGGLARLHWQVASLAAGTVAGQTAPDAPVLELRCVLVRPAAGPLALPDEKGLERVRPRFAALVERFVGEAPTLELADAADPLGPFASIVRVHLAAVRDADVDDVYRLAGMGRAARPAVQQALGAASAALRAVGRHVFLDAIDLAVQDACRDRLAQPDVLEDAPAGVDAAAYRAAVFTDLFSVVLSATAAWTGADVLDDELFARTAGPFDGVLAWTGHVEEAVVVEAETLAKRLEQAPAKRIARLVRTVDLNVATQRNLLLFHAALARGHAPTWWMSRPALPEGMSSYDRDAVSCAYEGYVAAHAAGSRISGEMREQALNPLTALR